MSTDLLSKSLTPLMQQYQAIKKNYSDAIVFFRLGDFYEMFGDDALKASPVLGIVLTKRHNIPMCGVPRHSVSNYIAKLIKKGFKVAICEQLELPGKSQVVKRGVVRLLTPGTLIEENLLDIKRNNFLLSIFPHFDAKTKNHKTGISYIDISTGDFFITEIDDDESLLKTRLEIIRINPSECLLPKTQENTVIKKDLLKMNITVNTVDDWNFEYMQSYEKLSRYFEVENLKSFGIEKNNLAVSASGAILKYIEDTQKASVPPLRIPQFYSTEEHMLLDESVIRNLELIENLMTKTRENTLLDVIDKTVNPMGSRLMRRYLMQPLTNPDRIKMRQETVAYLIEEGIMRRQVQELFKQTGDLERIISRISSGLAMPIELLTLKNTLDMVPKLKRVICEEKKMIDDKPSILKEIENDLQEMPEISKLIADAISDNPPNDFSKGGVIRTGYNPELDELRKIAHSGKSYLAELEQKERKRTGISSLKIGYTGVFGYYIDVTKANLNLVPPEYIRKQTLTSSERFITEELKVYEQKVLSAEEKITRMEQEIFNAVKTSILKEVKKIHSVSAAFAKLDLFVSLAKTAIENNYCRPEISYDYLLEIKDGRHPVLEKLLSNSSFIPNDISLDGQDRQVIILTGPNMSGKSTYLRQNALIVIMAQIGSYVPAKSARIGIIDRIFTRIGAADNLAGGESTFMVEMREAANIVNNCTSRSLLVLDEVGRGTSTFDGISIAWATVEFLSGKQKQQPLNGGEIKVGPKVLFATHYFELTELSEILPNVKNFSVSVKEWQGEVVFQHKIVPGPSSRSYGIHVAKLAGMPKSIINRATSVLLKLEENSQETFGPDSKNQLNLFSKYKKEPAPAENTKINGILKKLNELDMDKLTPIEALNILSELKNSQEKDKNY